MSLTRWLSPRNTALLGRISGRSYTKLARPMCVVVPWSPKSFSASAWSAELAPVAEALAQIRRRELPSELAAQVFVTQPPTSTPTGRYIGVVGFQRLLREQPSTTLDECVNDSTEPVEPDLPLRDVAERLASYDLLALPVCDDAGRLVGAVTVDDVLDHVLPEGWRRTRART